MIKKKPALALKTFARSLEQINTSLGQAVAWLLLVMAITVTIIVGLRAAGIGAVFAQESVVFMHAAVLMIASAYTLAADGHVRVDIAYRKYSPLQKAWLDTLGAVLFLLPVALFTILISWEFVLNSWQQSERSQNSGGLQTVYWIKSLMLIGGTLLVLQAIASMCKNLVTISFRDDTDA